MLGDTTNEVARIAKTVDQPIAVALLEAPRQGETRTSENRALGR